MLRSNGIYYSKPRNTAPKRQHKDRDELGGICPLEPALPQQALCRDCSGPERITDVLNRKV